MSKRKRSKLCYGVYSALIAAMLGVSLPAHAGHWEAAITGGLEEDQSGPSFGFFPQWFDFSNPDDYSCLWQSGCPFGYSLGFQYDANMAGCALDSLTASPTITLTWIRNDADDNPPPIIYLRETGKAQWECSASIFDDYSAGHADDGLGDTETITIEPWWDGTGVNATGKSEGTHLIQKDSSSGTVVLHRDLVANAINGTGTMHYWVAQDSRALNLTSSLGQTFHKGYDEATNEIEPIADEAGTINSAADTALGTGINFYAHAAGTWGANSPYQWTISNGTPDVTTPLSGAFYEPIFFTPNAMLGVNYSNSDIASGSSHVSIDATDSNDGSQATADINIQWHAPVENIEPDGPLIDDAPTFVIASTPVLSTDSATIMVPPDTINWSIAGKAGGGALTTTAAVICLLQPETSPVVVGFLAASGYTLSLTPAPESRPVTVSASEGDLEADVSIQETLDSAGNNTVPPPVVNRMDPALADTILASYDSQGNPDYNGYYSGNYGSLRYSVQRWQLNKSQAKVGDSYGRTGYIGNVRGTIHWPSGIANIRQWSLN